MPIEGLKASPHRLAFRRFVRIVRANLPHNSVKTWFLWDGTQNDRLPPSHSLCPYVALAPGRTSDRFLGPSSFLGNLVVDIEVGITGTNADDLFDLYHGIQRAFWPETDAERIAVRSLLLAVDEAPGSGRADTGEVVFTQPSFKIQFSDDGPMLVGTGQATLTLETINP